MAPGRSKEALIQSQQQKPTLRHHPYPRNNCLEPQTTKGLSDSRPLDEQAEDDQRILRDHTWESYNTQPLVLKQAIEPVVLMRLLFKFGHVSYEACAATLRDHNDFRTLLLEGWEKGTFQDLRSDSTFLSLAFPTMHPDNDPMERASQESMEDVSSEKFSNNAVIPGQALIVEMDTDGRGWEPKSRRRDDANEEDNRMDLVEGDENLIGNVPVNQAFERTQNINIHGGKFIHVARDSWQITYSNGDRGQTARWFFDIDYRAMHNEIAKKRTENTGEWFLQTETFQNWYTSPQHRVLWCPGIPGVGKTMTASLVVNHLRMLDESQTFVGVIYFNYKYRDQQNKLGILEALCRQMFEIREPSILQALHNSHAQRKSRPTEPELRSSLSNAFGNYQSCYLVLDALDEYTVDYSDKLLREIITGILSLGENVKLLTTSRVLGEMAVVFKDLEASREEIVAKDGDVRVYLRERVDSLRSRFDFTVPEEFSEYIIEKVVEAAKGRFLVAELGMNLLRGQDNLGDLEDALEKLPHEVDETYIRIVELIKSYPDRRRALAMKALMWVAYARRPLRVRELQHALATKRGKKETDKYITPLSTITSLCAGLIVVQDRAWETQADDDRRMRFVHFTTQEFFEKSQPTYFVDAHRDMFSTCIEYLSIAGNHILPADFTWASMRFQWNRESRLPFYDYAALNWGQHANNHHEPLSQEILGFLRRNDRPLQLSWEYTLRDMLDEDGTSEMDSCGIFLAAYHDQPKTLLALLDRMDDIPGIVAERTLMHVAAYAGRANIVEELLQWTRSSPSDSTPTTRPTARDKGKEHTLFAKDVRDRHGRTPFLYAVGNGLDSIVKLLLASGGIKVDSKDNNGRSPFSYAAEDGRESVLTVLLDHGGIEVDAKDKDGRTPLSYAAGRGRESTVKLLLEHGGVEVDSKDNSGRTPFSYAAEGGSDSVIKFLLEHGGVEIDSSDENGRTPLSHAAEWGRESTVVLLLGYADVKADSKDQKGRTPFSYAAEDGRDSVIKFLLDHGGVEIDSSDENGRTPLSHAAQWGRESTVKLLLGYGVKADSKDQKGRTPLSHAAGRGRELTVKFLLEHGGGDVNSKDNDGRTLLSHAAQWDSESTVKLLLDREDVEADSKDNNGRTALLYAATSGREPIVKLLIDREDVKVDSKDNNGRTPLSSAAHSGKESIVKLLLEHGDGDGNINSADNEGKTALYYANFWIHKLIFSKYHNYDDALGDHVRDLLDSTQHVADLLVVNGAVEFANLYGEEV